MTVYGNKYYQSSKTLCPLRVKCISDTCGLHALTQCCASFTWYYPCLNIYILFAHFQPFFRQHAYFYFKNVMLIIMFKKLTASNCIPPPVFPSPLQTPKVSSIQVLNNVGVVQTMFLKKCYIFLSVSSFCTLEHGSLKL